MNVVADVNRPLERSLATKAFQWLFFPVAFVTGVSSMGYAVTHDVAPALLATAIPVVVMVLIAVFERLLPFEPAWNRARGDVKADLLSLATAALGLETLFKIAGPVAVVWILARLDLPPAWHAFPRHWPLWSQCLLVIGVIELVKYWFHRLGHESRAWWPLHSVHHAVKRIYLLNGFRIHPVYHLLTYVLGYFPCILLGAPAETLLVHTVALGICGGFQHCNVDLKYGFLNFVFSTSEIHRWHHSTRIEEGNRNYGAILSVFDVLFGTYYNVPGASPAVIGMVKEQGYPLNSYWKQLAIPVMYGRWVGKQKSDPAQPGASASSGVATR
jgi:sterol desaturase/sphingolipid hydroxylase (fatty acid hydroxylase superfamily)